MKDHIKVVRLGPDPFGRTNGGKVIPTVFYRDESIDPTRVFYLWLSIWPKDWPSPLFTAA